MSGAKLTSCEPRHSINLFPASFFVPGRGTPLSSLQTNSGTVLGRIVEARRAEVARRQRVVPEAVLRIAAKKADPPRDFAGALCRDQINVIAEIEEGFAFGGPAAARISTRRRWRAVSRQAGAAALSVLTEEEIFSGRAGASARRARGGVAAGAAQGFHRGAVAGVGGARGQRGLVSADRRGAEPARRWRELLALGRELGMEPLVEVHTAEELDARAGGGRAHRRREQSRPAHARSARGDVVRTDRRRFPTDCIAVSESGLRSAEDLARLRAAGFDAFLIGEHSDARSRPGRGAAAPAGTAADRAPCRQVSDRSR